MVIDAALYGAALRILEWTLAGYDRLGVVRNREGNRLANSAPLDNYPTRDGKYVCIVAGSDTNFARLCQAMEQPDRIADARFAKLADRAATAVDVRRDANRQRHDRRVPRGRCRGGRVGSDAPTHQHTAADIFADPHGCPPRSATVEDP